MAGDRAAVRGYVRRAQEVREAEFREAPRKQRQIGEHPDNVRDEALGDMILEGVHAALELWGEADKGAARQVPEIVLQAVRRIAAARKEEESS